MKQTGNPQINTKTHWNGIYKNRDTYVAEQTGPTKRFEYALRHIKDGDKVLDIGCGVGVFTRLVQDANPSCEIWGTDISDKVIKDNLEQHERIAYFQGYVGSQDALEDAYFDVVFSGETLEHLDDPNQLFKDAHRVLKPGGTLIITTPNGKAIQSPEHTWFFNHDDIIRLYEENGFESPQFEYLPDMEHLFVIFAVGTKKGVSA